MSLIMDPLLSLVCIPEECGSDDRSVGVYRQMKRLESYLRECGQLIYDDPVDILEST